MSDRTLCRVITFGSTDDFFDALIGPRQHDAHVHSRRRYLVAMEHRARNEAFARMPLHDIFPQLRKRSA